MGNLLNSVVLVVTRGEVITIATTKRKGKQTIWKLLLSLGYVAAIVAPVAAVVACGDD